ncbi:MAG: C-type lectin domain-containing protein, partial [Oscillospiraceae bacterium]|nr:C-type lectin domain-containing protein [Oscillospiraceae bacterium]
MKKILSLLLILALALSLCACGSDSGKTVSVKNFHGLWKYEDSDRYIMINEDDTWDYRNADFYVLTEGNYTLKGDTLVLTAEDNSTAFELKQDGSKWLIDDEGKTLARYSGDDTGEKDGDIRPFLGMWKYDDCELLIGINADGTWTMFDINADAETRGTCYMRGSKLVMEDEDGYKVGSMSLGSDDRLYDSDGDALSPYSEEHTEDDPELLYFNGHSYKRIDLDMSWMDARAYCVQQGGHLVTITSPEEQDFLANNFYGQKLWIGAFESNLGWRWVTDEPWGYDNWRKGEPSGGEEWCGCFWTDMEWNDIRNEDPGERVSAFICEYDGLDDTGGEGRSEKKTPWFEDHDMYVNYRCGEPAKTVVGGASVRGQDTHSYTRIPADWYVEQTS